MGHDSVLLGKVSRYFLTSKLCAPLTLTHYQSGDLMLARVLVDLDDLLASTVLPIRKGMIM